MFFLSMLPDLSFRNIKLLSPQSGSTAGERCTKYRTPNRCAPQHRIPKACWEGIRIIAVGLLGGFWGASWGALGCPMRPPDAQTRLPRSPKSPQEASWETLGASWTASWGSRRPFLKRLGDILEASEAILGRLGASNGDRMSISILRIL